MLKKINLNKVFIIILLASGTIYSLPSKVLIGVYSPSLLGWFLVAFLVPLMFILLIWLSIIDLRKNRIKLLLERLLILIIVLGLSLGFKYLIKFF
ncbi:hypothetical protein ES677_15080 [Bizionia gelidisalsuginis]|uniref:Uncharacterized protein n=2 Tax=Bizionia TaxID=283785 RepID=A0A8H2LCL5_9FLAO|nr:MULTISPECIES: hypothetical protein [Bizionia]TYB68698.1 hypothetical protein ES676_14530 [Bizionia saleffrena]TYC07384.1 hypothetical protein ES677_15080 [Bizionia gelidisalsuginis]